MTDAKHRSQDPSFQRSLLRNVGGAVGLVVLVAALFGVLGMIGREDTDPLDIADGPEDATEEPAEAPDEEGAIEPAEPPAEEVEPPADTEPPDEDGTEEPADEPDTTEDEAEEPADTADEGADEAPAEESAPAAPSIDPSTISVQVLDGYGQDGGAATDAVYQQLEEAGYRIVARNPAVAYDVTTVLWTPGHEAEGQQVADAIGAAEVREQPGNLSSQVDVHVVVGADRG